MDEAAQRPGINYIAEINAFWPLARRLGLSAYARVLWFALMDINNRAGWKKEFNAPNGLLEGQSGFSHASMLRARKELVAAGLLVYRPGNGGRAALYELRSTSVAGEPSSVAGEPSSVAGEPSSVAGGHIPKHTKHTKQYSLTRERDTLPIQAKIENSAPDELDALFETLSLTSPELKKNVRAWLTIRARRGAPVTGYPLELLIANLKRNADGDEGIMNRMVEEAVSNGWLQAYRHDRTSYRQPATQPRHAMTEEERRKAFEEQAKEGGW